MEGGGRLSLSHGEPEGREESREGGERDVDDYAPAVLGFVGHDG